MPAAIARASCRGCCRAVHGRDAAFGLNRCRSQLTTVLPISDCYTDLHDNEVGADGCPNCTVAQRHCSAAVCSGPVWHHWCGRRPSTACMQPHDSSAVLQRRRAAAHGGRQRRRRVGQRALHIPGACRQPLSPEGLSSYGNSSLLCWGSPSLSASAGLLPIALHAPALPSLPPQVWPERSSSAAGVRTSDLVASFQERGWEAAFASSSSPNSHTAELAAAGVATSQVLPNRAAELESVIAETQPTAVVFDRFYAEEAFRYGRGRAPLSTALAASIAAAAAAAVDARGCC